MADEDKRQMYRWTIVSKYSQTSNTIDAVDYRLSAWEGKAVEFTDDKGEIVFVIAADEMLTIRRGNPL